MQQPVTLTATLIDAALAVPHAPFRGRVEYAYRAALYVRSAPSEPLAVVAIEDVGGVPRGMLVRSTTDLRNRAWEGQPIVVDTSAAVSWSPRLPAAAMFDSARRIDAWVDLARAIAATNVGMRAEGRGFAGLLEGGPVLDPFLRAAMPHMTTLRSALAQRDPHRGVDAALSLIGLGPGLTPSGDDFLVGLLAGLEATRSAMRAPLATRIAEEASRRTSEIAANALHDAASGEYTERLHDVLVAIACDSTAALGRAIARGMAYGATSGADTLVGLFLALDVAAAHPARAEAVA